MNRRDVCQAGLDGEKIITKPGKQRLQATYCIRRFVLPGTASTYARDRLIADGAVTLVRTSSPAT